jgi:serine protease AprX
MQSDRRTLLKAAGAAGAATLLPTGAATARTVDDDLDLDGGVQDVLVTFDRQENVDALERFDLVAGYHAFSSFPIAYTRMTGDQIERVARLSTVWSVEANKDLEYHNDDARELTGAETVQTAGRRYTGESAHVAVVDSGVDGDHPDFSESLVANYQFLNPLDSEESMWTDVGPANTGGTGHGTHVSGSATGEGTMSDGRYRGMAPDADLTVYALGGGVLLNVVGAYDHMIELQQQGRHDIDVVNNSYGPISGNDADYSPGTALNVATYTAFTESIVPVFSAGNSGPGTNTLSNYGKAPHVLASAATKDDRSVTGFSSRGRKKDPEKFDNPEVEANYDRRVAFENQEQFYEQTEIGNLTSVSGEQSESGTLAPGGSTIVGPDTGQSDFYDLAPQETANGDGTPGFIRATLTWDRPTDDLDLFLLQGGEDGDAVAGSTQGTGNTEEVIKASLDLDKEYTLEVDPFRSTGVTYEVTWEYFQPPAPSRPYGVYRPSAATPGNFVFSTMDPADPLQGYGTLVRNVDEQIRSSQEPFYGSLSGTSMSGPVLTGLGALTIDAYRQNNGTDPDPMDVMVTVEATAKDALDSYLSINVGAGFADAEALVRRAERGDLVTLDDYSDDFLVGNGDGGATETLFSVTGSRDTGATVYTAGQTARVTLTVDANEPATVRDRIPFDWEVVGGDADREFTEDGVRLLEFDVSGDGEVEVTYFLEAPEATGEYTFGPAVARPSGDEGAFRRFTDTGSKTVVGADTADPAP